MENMQVTELIGQSKALIEKAQVLVAKGAEITAEEREQVVKMTAEAKELKDRAVTFSELWKAASELEAMGQKQAPQAKPSGFKSMGDFLQGVYRTTFRG